MFFATANASLPGASTLFPNPLLVWRDACLRCDQADAVSFSETSQLRLSAATCMELDSIKSAGRPFRLGLG